LAKRDPRRAGVNVTAEDIEKFQIAIAWRYRTQKQENKKVSLARTFRWMRKELYTTTVIKDGKLIARPLPRWQRPTLRQFKHWVAKLDDQLRSLRAKHGHSFDRKFREVLHSAVLRAFGPGSIYEIDATVADVYLRSSIYPERLVGRPVVYLVKDVFSQMIVGLHVCLEGPNTRAIRAALENAFSDKVAYCRRFGVGIEEWEWPCHHLCHEVYGDRGELIGKALDHLPQVFRGLRLGNAPPYRADMKGLVERHFGICNEEIHWLPGAVRKRERGERDHRLDAKLDLQAFTQIMIKTILHYNKSKILTDYPASEDMIQDGVPLRPLDLWNWGLVNRPGKLSEVPHDVLRKHLLSRERAVITERGIRCRGLYYTCKRAQDEGWFSLARAYGRREVQVAVDELFTDVVYLVVPGEPAAPLEPCQLLDRHPAYKAKDWYDVLDDMENQKVQVHDLMDEAECSETELDAFVESVVQAAERTIQGLDKGRSKAEIVGNIREYRREEIDLLRATELEQKRPTPKVAGKTEQRKPAGADYVRFRQLREGG